MKNKGLESVLWRYYVFCFLGSFHLFAAVLVPFFTEWAGMSLAIAYGLQSWFMLWLFLLEIPTGVVADRIGRKHSVALGCLVIVFATLIYGSTPNLAVFALGELLFALSMALISGADKALLYDTLLANGEEKEASNLFGKSRSIGLLGLMLAAPLGSYLASKFGLNAPMLLTSIPGLLACAVVWTIPEPEKVSSSEVPGQYLTMAKLGWANLRRNPRLARLTINAVIVMTAAYFVIWLYQPFMEEIGIPIAYFGWAHTALVAAEIIIAANFGKLERLFGSSRRFLAFSVVATSISFFVAAVCPNIWTLGVLLVFAGGFGLTRWELMQAYMNRMIGSETRATTLSMVSMVRRLSLFIMDPIIGLIADHSLQISFLIVGLIPFATLFFPLNGEDVSEK